MIETLAEARAAVEEWKGSLTVRSACCPACNFDPEPAKSPTIRQLIVLYAYIATGSRKQAAAELGIAVATLQNHLGGIYERAGLVNQIQAAYLLGAGEWEGIK